MRPVALFALVFAGCSVTVGAGQIAPLAFDVAIPSDTWPPVAGDQRVELLSASDVTTLADQLGDKLGAVQAIDLEVDALAIMSRSGPMMNAHVAVGLGAVTIDHVGQRVRLPAALEQQLLDGIRQRQPVDMTVHFAADWPASAVATAAHCLVQPIVVLDAVRAL